jgi:hypothetical protein
LAHLLHELPVNAAFVVLLQLQLHPLVRSPATAVAWPLQSSATVQVWPQTG